jgi:hypothetical protein
MFITVSDYPPILTDTQVNAPTNACNGNCSCSSNCDCKDCPSH